MLDTKGRRQMLAQRFGAVAFGGVVAGGVEVDAVFAGGVHGGLGHFAGNKGIDAQRDSLVDIALGGTSAPGDAFDRAVVAGNKQRFALQALGQLLRQCVAVTGL